MKALLTVNTLIAGIHTTKVCQGTTNHKVVVESSKFGNFNRIHIQDFISQIRDWKGSHKSTIGTCILLAFNAHAARFRNFLNQFADLCLGDAREEQLFKEQRTTGPARMLLCHRMAPCYNSTKTVVRNDHLLFPMEFVGFHHPHGSVLKKDGLVPQGYYDAIVVVIRGVVIRVSGGGGKIQNLLQS